MFVRHFVLSSLYQIGFLCSCRQFMAQIMEFLGASSSPLHRTKLDRRLLKRSFDVGVRLERGDPDHQSLMRISSSSALDWVPVSVRTQTWWKLLPRKTMLRSLMSDEAGLDCDQG